MYLNIAANISNGDKHSDMIVKKRYVFVWILLLISFPDGFTKSLYILYI